MLGAAIAAAPTPAFDFDSHLSSLPSYPSETRDVPVSGIPRQRGTATEYDAPPATGTVAPLASLPLSRCLSRARVHPSNIADSNAPCSAFCGPGPDSDTAAPTCLTAPPTEFAAVIPDGVAVGLGFTASGLDGEHDNLVRRFI